MLKQLPIKRNVLILSRFFAFFTFSIPFHVLLLSTFYLFSSEIRSQLLLVPYLVFSIIWLCIGVILGAMFPTSDIGDKLTYKMWVFALVYGILLYGGE
ncbi:hypothetical protein J9303_20340 [Bacillaceae bacterium Marseille-Q3522]|nr:hypothetical protein [Bacillaceae bacterium Marseille-Q3522]